MSQEEDFRNLIGISPVGMAVIHEWTTIYFNPAAVQLFGAKSHDELIGMDGLLLIAPTTRDMVLSNILSGYEATRRIREFNKEVIIIAQTACGMSNERDNALAVGCNDYISKPIKRDELHRLIQNYLYS